MDKKKKPPQTPTVKPRYTLAQTMAKFSTEDQCKAYIRDLRWRNGVTCPRCHDTHVHEVGKKPFHWQCRKCNKNGYRFSVITGTIFENTNLSNKTMVLGAISRKENVVAQMVEE